jgi:hypothetical protein
VAAAHAQIGKPITVLRAEVVEPDRPAIAPARQITGNIFGMPSAEQAAIIRQALPGQAEGTIPEWE